MTSWQGQAGWKRALTKLSNLTHCSQNPHVDLVTLYTFANWPKPHSACLNTHDDTLYACVHHNYKPHTSHTILVKSGPLECVSHILKLTQLLERLLMQLHVHVTCILPSFFSQNVAERCAIVTYLQKSGIHRVHFWQVSYCRLMNAHFHHTCCEHHSFVQQVHTLCICYVHQLL